MATIRKGLLGEIKEADAEDFTIVAHVSTVEVDRDKEVVLPDGARLDRYRKNPIVLWHHDYGPDSLPLGKNLWIKTDKTGLLAKTQFNAKAEFSRDVFQLYRDGFMSAWSIGAGDVQVKEPTEEEIRSHPEWAGARGIWHSWELLEYSAVKVPANAGALTLSKAHSLGLHPITIKALDIKEAQEPGEPFNPLKPYPNEHAARLEPPEKYDSFRRQNDKFGPGIHAIFGILNGPPRKSELQAIRFDAKKFTVAEAKAWLKEHDYKPIRFEPASGEGRSARPVRIVVPAPTVRRQPPNVVIQRPDIRRLVRNEIRRIMGVVTES